MIWMKFCFWCAIFAVLLPSLFFLWMQKKGWIKPSGSLSMEFRDTADGSLVYSWRNGAPLFRGPCSEGTDAFLPEPGIPLHRKHLLPVGDATAGCS